MCRGTTFLRIFPLIMNKAAKLLLSKENGSVRKVVVLKIAPYLCYLRNPVHNACFLTNTTIAESTCL